MAAEPTETDARDLLARAAATIEVDDTAALTLTGLPEPTPRRWPPLLAATAAVVIVLGGGWLVATQLGTGDGPPRPAEAPVVEHEHVYGADEVPSLLGYTTAEARDLLAAQGVPVQVTKDYGCAGAAGYVLGSTPAQGTTLHAGDEVTLDVTGGPPPRGTHRGTCELVLTYRWNLLIDLIRFARGLDGPPPFGGEVTTFAGAERAMLTRHQAANATSWVLCTGGECHSAIGAIAEQLTAPHLLRVAGPQPNRYQNPTIAVSDGIRHGGGLGWAVSCGLTPDPLAGTREVRRSTYLTFEPPVDSGAPRCPQIQVNWTPDGEIGGVGLRLPD